MPGRTSAGLRVTLSWGLSASPFYWSVKSPLFKPEGDGNAEAGPGPSTCAKENAGPLAKLANLRLQAFRGFHPSCVSFPTLNLLAVYLQNSFVFENLPFNFCVNLEMGSPLKQYVPHRSRCQMHTPTSVIVL